MPIYLLSPSTILVVEVFIKLKGMIDDKKIEEAAINKCGFISSEFYSGAKWAINEFLKDLWHSIEEEPKHDKQITYVWGNGISKTIILNEEADKFNRTPSQIWHNICKNYKVARWLYIDDLLLPKKGGEE